MSSSTIRPGPQSKLGQASFPGAVPSSQALLLDKLNVRRSTPDSEALASSDDEVDAHRQENLPPAAQPPKPVRRASWLNDTSQQQQQPQQPALPRKGSFASSSMSPTTSHPSTPSIETGAGAWGSHSASSAVLGRGHAGSSNFPWGTGIWNNDRKEPPSRLSEVLPSPTSTVPPGGSGNSFFASDGGLTQTSPAPREQGPNPQIPFAIPLHPTPKTYRSQSYSVGQLEPDATTTSMGASTVLGTRGRPIPHSGLQHRPSRPSMLSEMASDGSMLGKVNEDDDDDSNDSTQGSQHQSAEAAKTIEMLTRENAMLRQQQQQQYQTSRLRPRASTSYGLSNGYLQESVPEESDYAVDEHEDSMDGTDLAAKRILARRMSEYGAGAFRSPSYMVENRKLENVKKAYWQSSLGFGGLQDIPQSRRHSFADVPTRQGSISSVGEGVAPHEQISQDPAHSQDYASAYPDNPSYPINSSVPSYFTGGAALGGPQQALAQAAYGSQYPSPYATLHTPYANRSTSPHRNMYGMAQPRHNQSLYIVLFKCVRADVFYIQEGTGLEVKPGDLVIVEADRGTDLGTVAKDNVDLQTAKELKEHYAEEHYKWLMMYSHNAAAAQEGAGAGLMAASNGLQGSAVGGMGPPNQHHMQELNTGELKPKLIKRLAQAHEVFQLKDKEGNEAKAKRVCMQKVKEHGLDMEILDAEFQMDWKKLTFYYFADSYINFNSLVTDLFKIYKTRIWMSAINPASFASPTLGLQAPSGVGPGAVGVGRGSGTGERRQNAQQEQQQATYAAPGQLSRVAPPFTTPFAADRALVPGSTYPVANYPYNPYGAFGNAARSAAVPGLPYGPGIVPASDAYAGGFPQTGDYPGRGRFPAPQSAGPQHDQGVSPLGPQTDWVGAFQGLSLNTR